MAVRAVQGKTVSPISLFKGKIQGKFDFFAATLSIALVYLRVNTAIFLRNYYARF
jgi:hypothetical protein